MVRDASQGKQSVEIGAATEERLEGGDRVGAARGEAVERRPEGLELGVREPPRPQALPERGVAAPHLTGEEAVENRVEPFALARSVDDDRSDRRAHVRAPFEADGLDRAGGVDRLRGGDLEPLPA